MQEKSDQQRVRGPGLRYVRHPIINTAPELTPWSGLGFVNFPINSLDDIS
jgi:hypothetical protein